MDLRYPIGSFTWSGPNTSEQRARLIHDIAATPDRMRKAVLDLKEQQLDTPYREGGWTVRQVVHHVPDSHMNAYVRFKLALTEHEPPIKPYKEDEWAKLADTAATPIETSLDLLTALHTRWVNLLRAMSPSDFGRTLFHPEHGVITLDRMLA